MQIVVETPYGEHDIDLLSSGEKELLFILVNLFRIRFLPSVILYDEPERHLNAGLESKIIPALDKLQTKNQIWMATHSIELIDSAPLQDIIELKRAGGTIQIEQSFDESKERRVQIFEALGARRGLQFSSNRIVFVEGKESNADKTILEKRTHFQLSDVLFIAGRSSNEVKGAGNYAQLIETASKNATFLIVLDRDYDDDESVEKLKAKFNNKAFIWDCHEIENLLLDSETLLGVLRCYNVNIFCTPEDVETELLSVAKDLEDGGCLHNASKRCIKENWSGQLLSNLNLI
jgi:predicted ATP-dependent endonuclease of OLD family